MIDDGITRPGDPMPPVQDKKSKRRDERREKLEAAIAGLSGHPKERAQTKLDRMVKRDRKTYNPVAPNSTDASLYRKKQPWRVKQGKDAVPMMRRETPIDRTPKPMPKEEKKEGFESRKESPKPGPEPNRRIRRIDF